MSRGGGQAGVDNDRRNGGVLVDFIGDELMSMWGAPTHQPDHAIRACRTGLEMLACLPQLNETWEERLGETVPATHDAADED